FEQTSALNKLCSFLSQNPCFEEIRIGDFVTQDSFLPAPDAIFSKLKTHIKELENNLNEQQEQKIYYVTGVNGLLKLWNAQVCRSVYTEIRRLLDDPKLHVWVFVNQFDSNVDQVFINPRYRESNQMFSLSDQFRNSQNSADHEETIYLVDKKYLSKFHGILYNNFRHALQDFGAGTVAHSSSDPRIYIGVEPVSDRPLSGIKDSIEQAYTLRDYFKLRHDLFDELSDEALQWLYDQFEIAKEYPQDVYGFIRERYFPKGVKESSDKLPKFINDASDVEKELLFWALRMNYDPDCYLSVVMQNPEVDHSNFTLYYVCQPLDFLSAQPLDYLNPQPTQRQIEKFIEQRQKGIAGMGVEPLSADINQFIQRAKSYSLEQVAPWLNNNAKEEKCEIIRRIGATEQASVPDSVLKSYPLLEMYLSSYNLPIPELNSYFTEYRTLKIKNRITEEFCQRAANITYPPYPCLKKRDALLQSYIEDEKVGLIVVDALSAEYLPLIIAFAQYNHIGLEEAQVCYCNLPTSTQFNKITWDPKRRIDDKSLDNIIHDGEEKHVTVSYENNFVTTLDKLTSNIRAKVNNALEQYERVILTSDHGSTRLAVIAYNNNLANTLPVKPSAGYSFNDWRYTSKDSVPEVTSGCITSLDGAWQVVKGYN
ncbi:MAG: hypothetical protein IKW80_00255, partial [Thermoguttaceae bacterium]|nr:hypothetical protein [Thermoguttaceae bacterium]